MDDTREARADRRRKTWAATLSRNGEHSPAARLDPDLGLSVMWELAVNAWRLTGRDLPEYARDEMPGVVIIEGRRR